MLNLLLSKLSFMRVTPIQTNSQKNGIGASIFLYQHLMWIFVITDLHLNYMMNIIFHETEVKTVNEIAFPKSRLSHFMNQGCV